MDKQSQTLEMALQTYSNSNWDNLSSLLNPFALAYNNAMHCATGFAPAFLLYGFIPLTAGQALHPLDDWVDRAVLTHHPWSLPVPSKSPSPILPEPTVESDHAGTIMSHFETFQNRAKQALQFSQVAQQRNYNNSHLTLKFHVGDLVLVNLHSLSLLQSERGLGRKLQMKYDDPLKATQKYSPTTYRLRLPSSYGMHPILDVSHLEPYQRSNPKSGEWPLKHLNCADFTKVPEFEVERIVAERWRRSFNGRRVQELLMHFMGYDLTYDKWLPRRNLRHAPEVLLDWDHCKSTQKWVQDISPSLRSLFPIRPLATWNTVVTYILFPSITFPSPFPTCYHSYSSSASCVDRNLSVYLILSTITPLRIIRTLCSHLALVLFSFS